MEKVGVKEGSLSKAVISALVLAALVFAVVVISYGLESVVPGVHDAFHDFRHVIGMPCH